MFFFSIFKRSALQFLQCGQKIRNSIACTCVKHYFEWGSDFTVYPIASCNAIRSTQDTNWSILEEISGFLSMTCFLSDVIHVKDHASKNHATLVPLDVKPFVFQSMG